MKNNENIEKYNEYILDKGDILINMGDYYKE